MHLLCNIVYCKSLVAINCWVVDFRPAPGQTLLRTQSIMTEIKLTTKVIFQSRKSLASGSEKPSRLLQVNYTLLAHDLTIRSAQEGVEQGFGELANMAPTFILRSETGYLAAIIRGDTRLSYKKIKQKLKLKDLCLATPEQVRQVTVQKWATFRSSMLEW